MSKEERFIEGRDMDFIERKIGKKLGDINSEIDIAGSDHEVLHVAYQDFTNYLKFHWNFIGKKANQWEFLEKLEKQVYGNPTELEAFLTVWITRWFEKWKERVKLLIGNQNQKEWRRMSEPLNNAEPYWKKFKHKKELTEVVICALLRKGEICGTEIIARDLLKFEFREKNTYVLNSKEHVFSIANNALRRARDISQSKGPLIFVKVDKDYFSIE